MKRNIFTITIVLAAAYSAAAQTADSRSQLTDALKRFEYQYNVEDGTDLSRVTMSAEAWTTLIAQVNAANLALDDDSRVAEYSALAASLNAQMDAVDSAMRLFKSYQAMRDGCTALSVPTTGDATADGDTDNSLREAIRRYNTDFVAWAEQQTSTINMNAFLGDNLNFSATDGPQLVTGESIEVYDVQGWEEYYSDVVAWTRLRTDEGQLYLRSNWTDKPVVVEVSKRKMLPEGQYKLSLRWNSDMKNMVNRSCYRIGETSKSIGSSTSVARSLSYTFTVAEGGEPFDIVIGFQKTNSGNAPAQIYADNVSLTCTPPVPSGIIDSVAAEARPQSHWFTLDGRRLLDRPSAPGIYISGGRKVVVK